MGASIEGREQVENQRATDDRSNGIAAERQWASAGQVGNFTTWKLHASNDASY